MTTYPDAPWDMVGQLWLTLFRVPAPVDDLRPAGMHGVAFVRYEEAQPADLLPSCSWPGRSASDQGRRVSISDIWADSPASVAGGRELWAIPKLLAEFSSSTVAPRTDLAHRVGRASPAGSRSCQARFG